MNFHKKYAKNMYHHSVLEQFYQTILQIEGAMLLLAEMLMNLCSQNYNFLTDEQYEYLLQVNCGFFKSLSGSAS